MKLLLPKVVAYADCRYCRYLFISTASIWWIGEMKKNELKVKIAMHENPNSPIQMKL